MSCGSPAGIPAGIQVRREVRGILLFSCPCRVPTGRGYIIIAGDIVDGVGIYPDQKNELKIIKIEEQYNYLAELLKKIPNHIKIFIIPGDHDATRSALPQPAIPKQYAKSLYELTNVTMLGNRSLINLNAFIVPKILILH